MRRRVRSVGKSELCEAAKHFHIFPLEKFHMFDDRPRWELANKSRAIQLSFSNRYLHVDVLTYGRCSVLLRQKMGFRLFVCLFAALYVCTLLMAFLFEFRYAQRARKSDVIDGTIPPGTCVGFSAQFSFIFLIAWCSQKYQISGTRRRYSSKRDSIASIQVLLLNQFRLEMDINAGSLVILIIVIQNRTW